MGKYTDQREKFYDAVISQYSRGMTAKEISKTIPVSKSTVYRWVEEHFGADETSMPAEIIIPRTPASVAKTIKAMAARISELEKQVDSLKTAKVCNRGDALPENSQKYEAVVKSVLTILKNAELI